MTSKLLPRVSELHSFVLLHAVHDKKPSSPGSKMVECIITSKTLLSDFHSEIYINKRGKFINPLLQTNKSVLIIYIKYVRVYDRECSYYSSA